SDKALVLRLADSCGYAGPETRFIATWGERDGVPPDAAFFPAVIKPHRSVVSVAGVRRKLLVTPVADAVACHRALDALPAAAFPVLLQRRVNGIGEGFFALRWGGGEAGARMPGLPRGHSQPLVLGRRGPSVSAPARRARSPAGAARVPARFPP